MSGWCTLRLDTRAVECRQVQSAEMQTLPRWVQVAEY